VCVCVCTRTCTCLQVCMHVCAYVMSACAHVCMYVASCNLDVPLNVRCFGNVSQLAHIAPAIIVDTGTESMSHIPPSKWQIRPIKGQIRPIKWQIRRIKWVACRFPNMFRAFVMYRAFVMFHIRPPTWSFIYVAGERLGIRLFCNMPLLQYASFAIRLYLHEKSRVISKSIWKWVISELR